MELFFPWVGLGRLNKLFIFMGVGACLFCAGDRWYRKGNEHYLCVRGGGLN